MWLGHWWWVWPVVVQCMMHHPRYPSPGAPSISEIYHQLDAKVLSERHERYPSHSLLASGLCWAAKFATNRSLYPNDLQDMPPAATLIATDTISHFFNLVSESTWRVDFSILPPGIRIDQDLWDGLLNHQTFINFQRHWEAKSRNRPWRALLARHAWSRPIWAQRSAHGTCWRWGNSPLTVPTLCLDENPAMNIALLTKERLQAPW